MNIQEALSLHELWLKTNGQQGSMFIAREANLGGVNLSGANLREAKLSRANLGGVNLSRANLYLADLSGANLREANLSGANLCGASLAFADLRGANLFQTDLSEADLNSADFSKADLSVANLCDTNLYGANLCEANLSRADLRVANLCGADLRVANLSGANLCLADLSSSKLGGANLSRVNLSEVKALRANFTLATLTGACIEDWHINTETVLKDIQCEYIYLKLNSDFEYERDSDFEYERFSKYEYADRRPCNEDAIFADGDFVKLVRKVQSTVDLIFRNGIDWKALAISFDKFKIESGNVELTVRAIENKDDGDFVIRVDVPANANKSETEKFLMQEYESARKVLEAQYRYQLEAKDREIEIFRQQNTNLTEIMKLKAAQPITINVVNTAISESKNVSDIFNINQSGAINPNASIAKDNARVQNILHNYPAEQQKSLAEAASEIQQLLEQLSATNPTTTFAEKSAVATKAVEAIEKNPNQKAKIVKAVKAGGIAALKELVEPVMKPITNILFPILEALAADE